MRHWWRIVGITLLVLGASVVGRLLYGPVPLNFLMPTLLLPFKNKYDIAYDRVELAWEGWQQPFVIRITNFAGGLCGGGPLLKAPKAVMTVKLSGLLKRNFVPTSLRLVRPEIRIPDEFNELYKTEVLNEQVEHQPLLALFVAFWEQVGLGIDTAIHQRPWKKLKQLQIENGSILLGEHAGGWSVSGLNVYLVRDAVAAQGTCAGYLERYSQKSHLESHINYRLKDRVLALDHQADNIHLSEWGKGLIEWPVMVSTPLKLQAQAEISLNNTSAPQEIKWHLSGEGGELMLPSLYTSPLALTSLSCKGHINAAQIIIHDCQIKTQAGPEVQVKGGYQQDGGLKVNAELTHIKFQDLSTWWPESLTPLVRGWVTRNIAKGDISKATLELTGWWNPGEDFKAQDVGGEINFSKATLDYITGMPLIQNIDGQARYTNKQFDIIINSGQTGSLKVSKGRVLLEGIDLPDQTATVDISVNGPVDEALALADHKPLNFLRDLGFVARNVTGTTDLDLHLVFPVETTLTTKQVNGKVQADLHQFGIDLPVGEQTIRLDQGEVHLEIEKGKLRLKGAINAAGAPAKFDWQQNLGKSWKLEADIKGPVGLAQPWFDVQPFLTQAVDTTAVSTHLSVSSLDEHRLELGIQADLTPLGITIKQLNWLKKATEPASLQLSALFKDNHLHTLKDLTIQADKQILHAEGTYDPQHQAFETLSISPCRLGKQDWILKLITPPQGSRQITLTGKSLDIASFLEYEDSPTDGLDAYGPMVAHVQVNELYCGEQRKLYQAKIEANRGAHLWTRAQVDGYVDAKQKQPLKLVLQPTPEGESLTIDTLNGGAFLKLLGISENIQRGKMHLEATRILPANAKTRQGTTLKGRMILEDYSIINAGFFTRLFALALVIGVVDLVMGEGIGFDRGKIKFEITDELVKLYKGLAAGVSLGITLEGVINRKTKSLQLNGSLIPAYILNSLIRNIPVVGKILSGGDKGVFATSFSVTGSQTDPKVSANPLSMLAPGMVKQFFKESHPGGPQS